MTTRIVKCTLELTQRYPNKNLEGKKLILQISISKLRLKPISGRPSTTIVA